ncbi:MAG: hypothetical protein J6036_03885 [Clostridia bacterium]|nr:hypothetical protein [Clostridia bacterium]
MSSENLNGKTVCEEIKEKILCGEELSDAEKSHVLSCDGCRTYSEEIKTMLADLENFGKESENLEKDGKTLVSSVMNEVNARKFFGNTEKKGGFSAWTKHFGLVAACVVLLIMAFPLIRNYGNLSKKDAVVYSDSTESINDSVSKDIYDAGYYVTNSVPEVLSGISDDEEEPAAENKAESDELPGRGAIVRSAPGGMSVGAAAGGKSSGADSEEISSRESSAIEDFYRNFNNDSSNTSIYGSSSGNGAIIITSPAVADSPDTVTGEDESVSEGGSGISDGVGLFVRNEEDNAKSEAEGGSASLDTYDKNVFAGNADDEGLSSEKSGSPVVSETKSTPFPSSKYSFLRIEALEKCKEAGIEAYALGDEQISSFEIVVYLETENGVLSVLFELDEASGEWKYSDKNDLSAQN